MPMIEIGYTLSSEEFGPTALTDLAVEAEHAGFRFAVISDHFHPWVDSQGHSPFVWVVIGAIARATDRLRLGTGVTCPIQRIHPAIIAQAAATAAAAMPGRFFLGVGTGERLNEHITGAHWPEPPVRQEMLREAVAIIRGMWKGELFSTRGPHFVVENARLYTRPEIPPPIYVAAAAPKSAELAAEIGDGFIGTSPDAELVDVFRSRAVSKPRYGQLTVCVADSVEHARQIALRQWPNASLPGDLKLELALPDHFTQAARLVDADKIAERVLCSADPEKHLQRIQAYVDAGYDHVYVHQIGPDQRAFFDLYRRDVLPRFH